MRFTKMHGLGNDYVYIDALTDPSLAALEWTSLAPALSDRYRGVGGDGVIVIEAPRSDANHARMRTFNADGSEAEACGNGTRCVSRYLTDRLGFDARLRIESGDRVLECNRTGEGLVRVAMGSPELEWDACSVNPHALISVRPPAIDVDGRELRIHLVSMGNPHAVAFDRENAWLGDDLKSQIRRLGPTIESHSAFMERINVHFVRVDNRQRATMYTWERGAGITQACGTGACAVLVAGVGAGVLSYESTLTLPGGDLGVTWQPKSCNGDGIVHQTGPAEFVFDGVWIDQRERIIA